MTSYDRRKFLTTSFHAGCTLLCGATLSQIMSGCDTIDTGEPIIRIAEVPALQHIGGAIKKRYSKVNNGKPIIIICESTNHFIVYSALCTHQGTELKLPKDGVLVCPNHGSRFNVADGKVVDGEAYQPLEQIHAQYNTAAGTLTIGS